MCRGVYLFSAVLLIVLSALYSCSKNSAPSRSSDTPADTTTTVDTTTPGRDLPLTPYTYVDTARPFVVTSAPPYHLGEPVLSEERLIGEPYTDINHNGVYDPGIDGFFHSSDPATNQDLNHNGRHDGPENMGCNQWWYGIPFDDIDGNGSIRCSEDYPIPMSQDSFAKFMPFADLNENGIWDSALATGMARGRWKWNHLEFTLWFRSDSAYRFVSDSGFTYYESGFGGDPHLMLLFFVQTHDILRAYGWHLTMTLSRNAAIRVPSVSHDTIIYDYQTVELVRKADTLVSLTVGDSTYPDILDVKYTLVSGEPNGPEWEFYFGRQRGLLKAVTRDFADSTATVYEVMDKPLPLPMTRRTR